MTSADPDSTVQRSPRSPSTRVNAGARRAATCARQKNLTVVTKAEVSRVIIRDGRAVGVEYRRRAVSRRHSPTRRSS